MVEAGRPLRAAQQYRTGGSWCSTARRVSSNPSPQLQARPVYCSEQDRLKNNAEALARIRITTWCAWERALGRRRSPASESRGRARQSAGCDSTTIADCNPSRLRSNSRQEALRVQQLPQIGAQLAKLHEDISIKRARNWPASRCEHTAAVPHDRHRSRGQREFAIAVSGSANSRPESGFKVVASVDEYYLGACEPDKPLGREISNRELPLEIGTAYISTGA